MSDRVAWRRQERCEARQERRRGQDRGGAGDGQPACRPAGGPAPRPGGGHPPPNLPPGATDPGRTERPTIPADLAAADQVELERFREALVKVKLSIEGQLSRPERDVGALRVNDEAYYVWRHGAVLVLKWTQGDLTRVNAELKRRRVAQHQASMAGQGAEALFKGRLRAALGRLASALADAPSLPPDVRAAAGDVRALLRAEPGGKQGA